MTQRMRVFLLAGQSNMGAVDSLVDPDVRVKDLAELERQEPADREGLFCYGKLREPETLTPWGDVRGHRGSFMGEAADVQGHSFKVHGPEITFSRALHAAGIRPLALVKVWGNFAAYEQGHSPWTPGGSFWASWMDIVDCRLHELTARGIDYRIAGFLWHQGIDDGIRARSQAQYENDLEAIIGGLRARFGVPDAPFVLARSIDSPIGNANGSMAPIRAGQVAVAERVPATAWIDVDDLGPWVNQHHMTAQAQREAGRRFAAAYLSVSGP